MNELSGRVALVTGGSRGIGAAVARRLAGAGAAVAVNAHASPIAVQAVVAQIIGDGGRALGVLADIAGRDAGERIVTRVLGAWGRLDIVVCAAGLNLDRPFSS